MLPNELAVGQEIPGPPGTRVTYEGVVESRAVDIPPEWWFALTIIASVSAQLIAH